MHDPNVHLALNNHDIRSMPFVLFITRSDWRSAGEQVKAVLTKIKLKELSIGRTHVSLPAKHKHGILIHNRTMMIPTGY